MSTDMLSWTSLTAVVVQWVAVFIVVLAAIWIVRLHRRMLDECQRLQAQTTQAEESHVRLQALLADLLATMNLSLAHWATGFSEADRTEIERIQAAVQKAIERQSAATTDG